MPDITKYPTCSTHPAITRATLHTAAISSAHPNRATNPRIVPTDLNITRPGQSAQTKLKRPNEPAGQAISVLPGHAEPISHARAETPQPAHKTSSLGHQARVAVGAAGRLRTESAMTEPISGAKRHCTKAAKSAKA